MIQVQSIRCMFSPVMWDARVKGINMSVQYFSLNRCESTGLLGPPSPTLNWLTLEGGVNKLVILMSQGADKHILAHFRLVQFINVRNVPFRAYSFYLYRLFRNITKDEASFGTEVWNSFHNCNLTSSLMVSLHIFLVQLQGGSNGYFSWESLFHEV